MRGRRALCTTLVWLFAAQGSAGGAPAAPDARPRPPIGDAAQVHWDLAAHFDSGHRVYARFLVTNEGPGERTAVAFGHVIDPEGKATRFQNGRREGSWELRDAGRRIKIGSSELLLGENVRRLEVDNDKRGIEIRVDIPADGSGLTAEGHPAGGFDLLNLATRATGRLWLDGMPAQIELTGRAVLTHTRTRVRESDFMRRRIDVATWRDDGASFLTAVDTPSGERWSWLATSRPGRPSVAREGLTIVTRPAETAGGYPIPVEIQVRGRGVDGIVSLRRNVLRVDPLDALPRLLKMVYSFRVRPLHTWADASADLTTGARSRQGSHDATGFAALYFADSLPPVSQP